MCARACDLINRYPSRSTPDFFPAAAAALTRLPQVFLLACRVPLAAIISSQVMQYSSTLCSRFQYNNRALNLNILATNFYGSLALALLVFRNCHSVVSQFVICVCYDHGFVPLTLWVALFTFDAMYITTIAARLDASLHHYHFWSYDLIQYSVIS